LNITCATYIFWRICRPRHDDGTAVLNSDLLSQKAAGDPSTLLSLLPLVAHCLMVPHTHSAVLSAGLELLENLLHVTEVVALSEQAAPLSSDKLHEALFSKLNVL